MTPALSFVLVTDLAETVRDVLASLRRQTIRDRLELVLVCPAGDDLGLAEGDVEGIGALRIVPVGAIVPLAEPHAAGVRAASAPVVVLGETHAFPRPDALQALLAVFGDERVGAAAPTLTNANPETAASWASLMATYGRAIGGPRREVGMLSTHNTAYRRDLLLACGGELAFRLTLGGGLDADLRSRGFALVYEPAAAFAHLNVARLRSTVLDRFFASRCYAASRARSWSPVRRAAHAAAAPAVPLLLALRVVRSSGWAEYRRAMPRTVLPWLLASVVPMAAGEAVAYALGAGDAFVRVARYELHRARHV